MRTIPRQSFLVSIGDSISQVRNPKWQSMGCAIKDRATLATKKMIISMEYATIID
jgi:hypothetical protein